MDKEEKTRDQEALKVYLKALRWEKEDAFKEYFLKRISENSIINRQPAHSYEIYSVRFGRVLFYPVLNRCFLLRKSKWIKPGLQWIIQNLLK